MKLEIFIDKHAEEKCIVYANEKSELVLKIEQLIKDNATTLMGYNDDEYVPLSLSDIYCFSVESNKVYAYLKDKNYALRQRLYEIEGMVPQNFVKINQSCIVNVNMVERFSAAISGALMVNLKNGYKDYVSRRNLKNVKERLGILK